MGLGATGNPAFQSSTHGENPHVLDLQKFEYGILDDVILVRPDTRGRD